MLYSTKKENKMKKATKVVSIVLAGSILGFGGCLGVPTVADVATYAALEYVFDNDSGSLGGFGFDLFQDDFGTGAEFDDRFVAEPVRVEP